MTSVHRTVIVLLMLVANALSIAYDNDAGAEFIRYWCDPNKQKFNIYPESYSDPGTPGDCQQMTCHGMQAACEPNKHFLPDRERLRKEWRRIKSDPNFKCKNAEFPLNADGTLSRKHSLIDYLCKNGLVSPPNNLGMWGGSSGPLPRNEGGIRARIPELRQGDILEIGYGNWQHSMTVVKILDGIIYVGGSSPHENDLDLCKYITNPRHKVSGLRILHIPNTLGNCREVQCQFNCDSTVKNMGIRHKWICCWHEHQGGDWPLTSKRSAYACLHWSEASGTTWDTLITPRLTFAGCSDVVMRLESYSTLNTGVGNSCALLACTTDARDWFTLGNGDDDDTITVVEMPWAAGKRNVRIAWAYHGDVQPDSYWCIDEVKFFAKPSRSHDMSVSEILWPKGILTPGQSVTPSVMLWNHGCAGAESVKVTLEMGGLADSVWVKLLAHSDTVLEFSPMTLYPDTYEITCHVDAPIDAIRGNDTASLTFSVVGDTWIQMCKVFGGGGMTSGGCMATVNSDSIFCVTGKSVFFANYVVRDNIWKNRPPIPKATGSGGALAYSEYGDWLYTLRGQGKQFYRYRLSTGQWDTTLARTPKAMGRGGDMTFGPGDTIYALRGSGRTFYRYKIGSNSWDTLPCTPGNIKIGGSLVWDGGDYLYALRGGDSFDFYRYKISTKTWEVRRSTPVHAGDGAALAFYPQGGKIFAFFGDDQDYFYACDIARDSWLPRHPAPHRVRNGGCLARCDYSVFAGLGMGGGSDFWRYSPAIGGFAEAHDPEPAPLEQTASLPPTSAGVLDSRSGPEELLTFDPADKYTPRYSPSGVWIAYTATDPDGAGSGLYRIPALGGQPDTLGPDSLTFETPRWANSGNWLVVATDDGIYKMSSGMPPLKLADGIASNPQVTDNDSWVLYECWDGADHAHHVHRARTNGTGDSCLTPGPGEYLEPQPMSDSDFACVRLKGELYQLSKKVAGEEAWLTSDYMHSTGIDLSPSKQWITYEKLDESDYWQVYKMRIDGTEESRITDGTCNCETPVFSPDGRYIAYTKWPVDSAGISKYSQVCYKDTTSAVSEVALNSANAVRKNPCWSPDCRYIIYEVTVESGTLAPGKKKQKQIGRVRTRLKPFTGVEEISGLPRAFALYQNRPNPFGRSTTIRYAIPVPSFTELSIYDIAGRTVTRLVQSEQRPGYYSVRWNGADMRGRSVPAGTYFYVLKSNGKIAQKRMLLVR